MKHTKHTPGPWSFSSNNGDFRIHADLTKVKHLSTEETVARIFHERDLSLIAAAPELLEALCETLSCIDQHTDDQIIGPIIKFAKDAIRKATGGAE